MSHVPKRRIQEALLLLRTLSSALCGLGKQRLWSVLSYREGLARVYALGRTECQRWEMKCV